MDHAIATTLPPRICVDGGSLVGPAEHLPAEAWDFYGDLELPRWGCNRLACRACGAEVRAVTGVALARPDVDFAALWAAHDCDAAVARGELVRSPTRRLYVCRCQGLAVDRALTPAEDDGDDVFAFESPPWGCAGHPRLVAPAVIDGVLWSEASAEANARAHLEGRVGSPYVGPRPSAPLVRIAALWSGTPLAASIVRAVREALEHDRCEARARAADFYRFVPGAAGAERVAWLLSERRAWFEGARDPFQPQRAADERFQDAVAARFISERQTPEEVALVKSLIVRGTLPTDLLVRGLAASEPAWLLDVAPTLLARAPSEAVLARLVAGIAATRGVPVGAMTNAVVALARIMPAARVRHYAATFIVGRARAATLAALVDLAGPAPA